VLALVVVSALHQLGVDLSILLGAAGILTVAIGFASQTSASNIISGLFLVAERPFVVGTIFGSAT
jgi:small-conductance mechanosensitive channel